MGLLFEWNGEKAKKNLKKHKVSFEEGSTIFGDQLSVTIDDPMHSEQEDRFVTVGQSVKHRLLVVAHIDRGTRIRIISARKATHNERKSYEER